MKFQYLALVMTGLFFGVGAGDVRGQERSTATGLWQQIDESTGKSQGWFLIYENGGVY